MENGPETDHGDIKDINVVKLNSKKILKLNLVVIFNVNFSPLQL